MAKLLKDSTAKELTTMIQARKDMLGAMGGSSRPYASLGFMLMELVAEIGSGNDLWEAKEITRNLTSNQWDATTDGRETTSDIPLYVEGGGKVGDKVRAFFSRDVNLEPLLIAFPGGGSGTVKILINGSTTSDTYTGNIVNNRTDKTVIESGVTVKLLDHDGGTLSASDDIILDCTFDSDNEWYEAVNYNYFYPG